MSRGFGTLGKIFLEFEEPFWPKDCEGINLIWTKSMPVYERLSSLNSEEKSEVVIIGTCFLGIFTLDYYFYL